MSLGLACAQRTTLQQRLIQLAISRARPTASSDLPPAALFPCWQGDNGLSETGHMTAEQVRSLQPQIRV